MENETERANVSGGVGGLALPVQSSKGEAAESDAVNIMFYVQ